MRLSLSWLREYVRLPEDGLTVARLLTEHAFETTVVPAPPRATLDKIRVGEVRAVRQHPNADRLTLVTVRTSRGDVEVVCGAPNVRDGLRVAVALQGAKLITAEGTLEALTAATIRGVRSGGMICSERELGLGSEHGGILELPSEAKVGASLSTLFPEDTLLEAEVLPDRAADCQSHIGVARELGAILRRVVKLPTPVLPRATAGRAPFRVVVEDRSLCPRYIAVVLDGLRRQPSPLWLAARLRSVGVRPQNLPIDVTNFVLWEVGQPTHAFDARAIGQALGVRKARRGERLRTLDGVERELPEGALVITSDDRPIALAGIMGGAESGVRDDTTRIVLEAALFDRATIRKTVQELGLRTGASDRFSKSVSTASVGAGAARAVELLTRLGGARVVAVVDVAARVPAPRPVTVPLAAFRDVLGMPVTRVQARSHLTRLGYRVSGTRETMRVTPPPFRTDVGIPEDVIEDVGRLIGYDRVPATLPRAPLAPALLPQELRDVRRIQDALKGAGWAETATYSFMQEEEALALQLHKVEHLQVVNPVHRDHVRLRTTLLPNLLHLAWSAVKKVPLLRAFEVGHVFPAGTVEENHVAGILVRRGERQAEDFYEVKGVVEHLLQELGLPDVVCSSREASPQETFLSLWEPGALAEVRAGGFELGVVGEVSTGLLNRFRVQGGVVAFELNLSRLGTSERAAAVYNPPFPFPTIQRDVSLLVPEGVLVDEILAAVTAAGGALVQDADFVDQYEGPEAGRSVTLRVTYGSQERTLRDDEVNTLHRRIVAKITEDLGVEERT